jgi:hypothetical protein
MTIDDGLFVVRVTIGVENTTLSQALAANSSLELAEDIACNRALERLALTPKASEGQAEKVVPLSTASTELKPLASPSLLPLDNGPSISTSSMEQQPNGLSAVPEVKDDPLEFAIKLDLGEATADPIDLSDIIAQTDVELQRLGWDVNQGREFLEKTYGKRSRHDLTDEELLEFLLYLESQPMPSA